MWAGPNEWRWGAGRIFTLWAVIFNGMQFAYFIYKGSEMVVKSFGEVIVRLWIHHEYIQRSYQFIWFFLFNYSFIWNIQACYVWRRWRLFGLMLLDVLDWYLILVLLKTHYFYLLLYWFIVNRVGLKEYATNWYKICGIWQCFILFTCLAEYIEIVKTWRMSSCCKIMIIARFLERI